MKQIDILKNNAIIYIFMIVFQHNNNENDLWELQYWLRSNIQAHHMDGGTIRSFHWDHTPVRIATNELHW